VFHFRQLAQHLGSERPVYGLLGQLLDEEGRYLERVEELATLYVRDVRRVRPTGPYHLLGFCFGGLVAYEMARQLRQAGEAVGFVGLIETDAPGAPAAPPRPAEQGGDVTLLGRLRHHAAQLRAKGVPHLLHWAGTRRKYEGNRFRIAFQRGVFRLFHGLGLQPPRRLNGFATAKADEERAARYAPAFYDGVITVIGPEQAADGGSAGALARAWGPMAREVRALAVGADDHGDAVLGAGVRPFAHLLRAALADEPAPPR
jgi:thioesterase domain-containing protein